MELTPLGPWEPLLRQEWNKPYWRALCQRVDAAYAGGEVYPPRANLFSAFSLTPPERVRVVILGQDPYHEPGQAHGLAFSVREGVKPPPSLVNIYKELSSDLDVPTRPTGCLTDWAEQGVLLLNTVLTVERGRANSHREFGWQQFTDAVLTATVRLPQPLCYVLWGAQAQKKEALLRPAAGQRLILSSPHPSPLSSYRGFFGSRPFSQMNRFLEAQGEAPIEWI
ncbi:MAG: uracil-DNA glycosylase [Oscillospiraceae bacterium]|nr:uracil-DNA glycosylase [Oscillospiraceae bacterium]